jgi:hypothetical protein
MIDINIGLYLTLCRDQTKSEVGGLEKKRKEERIWDLTQKDYNNVLSQSRMWLKRSLSKPNKLLSLWMDRPEAKL